jgi:hypothetical protein
MKKSRTKIFRLLLFCVLAIRVSGCADLDRSNPLDPKNPDGQRERTVLVEAFVNDQGGALMNAALDGLNRLCRDYDSHDFLLLEHHIQKTANTDPKALEASLTRYYDFVPQTNEQAIPDVFFDGLSGHVQGASDAEIAYQRYRAQLEERLAVSAQMTIEISASVSNSRIMVTADIAQLGEETAEDVIAQVAVIGGTELSDQSVVRALIPVETLGSVDGGSVKHLQKEIVIDPGWNQAGLSVVLIMQNSRTREVYQCAQSELEN